MSWLERTRRFLVGLAVSGTTAAAFAGPIEGLRYIGQQTLPTGTMYSGTQVGGLSGIDYDSSTGTYWAISDDRSATGPARFYNTSLNFDQNGFYGVTFNSVQTMKRSPGEGGGTFPLNNVDPEA
ncbi:MAG: esterase-like activity of phytase family protein, partial [Planctomycetota bacterium]|nr:esterase-like activity of phytase family protein [Planctomycetota bacterium]